MEHAGLFDTWYRRLLQNPNRILGDFIEPGMTVMDIGCGPGYFTVPMARMVGPAGRVIAADVQKEMLDLVGEKMSGLDLEGRIVLHVCQPSEIGITEQVDFALAFYMVHEAPDTRAFLQQVFDTLKAGGRMLVAEPPFHVSSKTFNDMLTTARQVGYDVMTGPGIFLAKTAVLAKPLP
jgi:ubiquinone/menaquinone biosynthesis C-methylase UbiE